MTENLKQIRINKFHEFLDKISESLDSAVEINFIEKTDEKWYGEFLIFDINFFLLIKIIETANITKDDRCYICKFGNIENDEKKFKKLKDNDTLRSLKVLATIKFYLNLFLTEINPRSLTFFGSDSDITRIKLYQKFCDEIINKNNNYFDLYHLFRGAPIFIICENNFNILKIKDFYIDLFDFYKYGQHNII